MSRITGSDAKGLMEAYSAVYAPQELTEEQVWEEVESWVNSLLEEGYDLSDYTWEEMYESYLSEAPALNYGNPDVARYNQAVAQSNKDRATRSTAQRQVQTALGQGRGINVRGATTGADQGRGFGAVSGGRQGIVVNKPLKPGETQQINVAGRTLFPAKSGNRTVYLPSRDSKPATPLFKSSTKKPDPVTDAGDNGGGDGGGDRNRNRDRGDLPGGGSRPALTKVAPAPTKPAAAAQTGDKAKDMATWAKANPKLAAAAAERARTRGTSATTNPQMDGLKSRLPAPAATPTPSPARNGFGVSAAPIAARASVANVTAPEVKATNTIAAKTTSTPVAPKAPAAGRDQMLQRNLRNGMEYDAYDVVLEYLLSQGHAETVEEAHYVMLEMDSETIGSIVEERRDPRGRVSSGPMNVYRKPEGKPSQAHLDAVAAHRESEKKKSPEQKKKELDDYIQRQRENK